MKKYATINVVVHTPTTPESVQALAQKVSEVHASIAVNRIQDLSISKTDKAKLLDALKALTTDN